MRQRLHLFIIVIVLLHIIVDSFRLPVQRGVSFRSKIHNNLDSSVTDNVEVVNEGIKKKTYTNRQQYDELEQGLVLDDFGQICEAIGIFGQVFGDLDIPVKFEIPAQEPVWPSSLHGLRLGKRLEKLFSSNEFFEKHPEKVKEISKLGLVPALKSLVDDWTLIHESMVIYKRLYGNLRISSKFVVPDEEPWSRLSRNLKLGIRVAAIRSAGRYVKDHPERKAELDEMGFEWRLRDHMHTQQVGEDLFQQVFEALKFYKTNVNDELNVAPLYVVPAEDIWPVEMHGMKLGLFVQGIREEDKLVFGHSDRVAKLNEIGFPWEETSRSIYSKKRFDLIYAAMVKYKSIHGDLFVPQSFVVPSTPEWPEATWELKLGARVNAIRSQGTFVANSPERRDKLDALEFSWELPSEIKRRKRMLAKQLGGDNDDEETATRGGTTGDTADASSASSTLDDFGNDDVPSSMLATFNDDFNGSEGSGSGSTTLGGMPATSAAAKRIKNMNLPGRIAGVPKSVLSYDASLIFEPIAYREVAAEAMREYMMSRELSPDPKIRQYSHFEGHLTPQEFNAAITRVIPQEDMEALKRVGYRIVEFGKFNWEKVHEGFVIYKAAYGNINIPHDWVVNESVVDSDIGFDESFEDMQLGEVVHGLRTGDIDGYEDPVRRKQLQSLSFKWEYEFTNPSEDGAKPKKFDWKERYQRYRFFPMLLGLKVYKHLYGFAMPQSDFVVPDEPQWPYWMCGMPLGEWSMVARIQQQMMLKYYPHRMDMLNAMEFLWWVPPPQDFTEKYYDPPK